MTRSCAIRRLSAIDPGPATTRNDRFSVFLAYFADYGTIYGSLGRPSACCSTFTPRRPWYSQVLRSTPSSTIMASTNKLLAFVEAVARSSVAQRDETRTLLRRRARTSEPEEDDRSAPGRLPAGCGMKESRTSRGGLVQARG